MKKQNKSAEDDLVILIGEKGGTQARDNAFNYFFHRMNSGYKNTFFVTAKGNIDFAKLEPYKKNIITKNSKKHIKLFFGADYLMVNDGYLDVFPKFSKKPLNKGWSPIIYLQHGIISYKKVFFHKGHYNGRIQKFITSLKSEYNIVHNSFQSNQDYLKSKKLTIKHKLPHYANHFTREDLQKIYHQLLQQYYNKDKNVKQEDLQSIKRLILNIGFLQTRIINSGLSRHENLANVVKKPKNILLFFTWREEWTKKSPNNDFISLICRILDNKSLRKYAELHNLEITIYLHEKILHLKETLLSTHSENISFVGLNDFSSVLSDTAICITDYSSVSFEFNLLKIPVIFLHFDYDKYKYYRGHYLSSPYEFSGTTIRSINELEYLFNNIDLDKLLKKSSKINNAKIREDYENFGKSNSRLDQEISSRTKHIVYFCYNIYGIGGTVQTVINQANHLVNIGYQVTVISMRRTSETPLLHIDPSIRLEHLNDVRNKGRYRTKLENFLSQLPSKSFFKSEDLYAGLSLLIDIKLKRILKTFNNSVLIGTFPGLCVNIIKHANASNKVIIQEHKQFSSHSKEIQNSIIKHYKKASKLVTLTNFQKEEYNNQGIKNIAVIPNGIKDNLDIIKLCNYIPIKKRIVSFGRLVKMKQFDFLIESFSYLAKSFPDWNLEIYGDGEEKENLIKLIYEYGLTEQVFIHPPTSLVFEELYNSSFCALTSESESFGMVYIESFSMGKPVVSYDINYGPKAFLQNNFNSLVSPCFDKLHFSGQMRRLMENEDLCKSLGNNARKTYLQNYEISKVVSEFIKET